MIPKLTNKMLTTCKGEKMQRMKEKFNRCGIYEIDHTKFGGYILLSDFNTNHPGKRYSGGSQIANRIAADTQFDKQCEKNRENTKKKWRN